MLSMYRVGLDHSGGTPGLFFFFFFKETLVFFFFYLGMVLGFPGGSVTQLGQLFVTPWAAAYQVFLPITNSQNLLILMSTKSMMPSNHLILCFFIPFSSCLQSFPVSGSFPMNQFFTSGGWSIGVSASVSVLPMNNQDLFPLGLTSLISLQSKGLSRRVFSNTTVQKHQFFSAQPSL